MAQYTYHVEIEWSYYFANRRGGPVNVPQGTITTVITSTRRLSESFVCRAATTQVHAQLTRFIRTSPTLARAKAQASIDNCFVYPTY